jgi:hypothetical protein
LEEGGTLAARRSGWGRVNQDEKAGYDLGYRAAIIVARGPLTSRGSPRWVHRLLPPLRFAARETRFATGRGPSYGLPGQSATGVNPRRCRFTCRQKSADFDRRSHADDTIVGFQHRQDAERFQIDLKERLAKFALSLHPEKTRLLEFGRYAAGRRAERGQGKPETFDFLGFTHYCTTRKDGAGFQLGRKTQRKRMKAKLREIKETLRRHRHTPIDEQGRWLGAMMKGNFAYFAVPTNTYLLSAFRYHISIIWFRSLRRRSQRHRLTWERMVRLIKRFLPSPRVLHPWPNHRFNVKHSR